MKFNLYTAFFACIMITGLLSSCNLFEEEVILEKQSFVKYYGQNGSYTAKDIEPIYATDNENIITAFVIFGTTNISGGDDYYFLKVDTLGNILAETTLGYQYRYNVNNTTTEEINTTEIPGQIEILSNRDIVFVGTSRVIIEGQNATNFPIMTTHTLTEDLMLKDSIEVLTETHQNINIIGNDVIEINAINTKGEILPNEKDLLYVGAIVQRGGMDFYYAKHKRNNINSIVWKRPASSVTRNNGSLDSDDVMVRAFEDTDGYVLFGYNYRVGNQGETGTNVYFQKVSKENGFPVSSNAFGIIKDNNQTDEVVNSVIKYQGGYAVVGTSFLTSNERFAFFMNFTNSGIIKTQIGTSNGINNVIDTNIDTTNNDIVSEAYGITQTKSGNFVVVGKYPNLRLNTILRNDEIMFININQDGESIEGNERNYGIAEGDDTSNDVITLPSGGVVVLTTIDFGASISLISLMKLSESGNLDN